MIVIPDEAQRALEEHYARRSGLRGIRDILADVLVSYELAPAVRQECNLANAQGSAGAAAPLGPAGSAN